MINNDVEQERALEEVEYLQKWLDRLYREHPVSGKEATKASVRKMMARITEELTEFECRAEMTRQNA